MIKLSQFTTAQQATARGFSLLEVLLSLALASLLLLAASYLVQLVTQRANWWYKSSEMLMLRQSIIKSLANLSTQVCEPGLAYGGATFWRWQMQQGGRCQVYDIRHNKAKQQLQKRRLGGRYTGFVDAIWDFQVTYGIAEQGSCSPGRWLPDVSGELAQQAVVLRLQYAVGIDGAMTQYLLPPAGAVKDHELLQVTHQVVRLPCVPARPGVSE